MKTLSWKQLLVSDDANTCTIMEALNGSPELFDSATIRMGAIVEWPGYFLSVPGSEPNWNIPAVDWSGFINKLAIARGEQRRWDEDDTHSA